MGSYSMSMLTVVDEWLATIRPAAGIADVPVIYTASFGQVDDVLAPAAQSRPMRFVCFVEHDRSLPGWEAVKVGHLPWDSRRASRVIKLFPHILFPSHSTSVWVDASAHITGDISEIVQYVTADRPIAAMPHGERRDVYSEEKVCRLLAKDDPKLMRKQIERYRAEGLPRDSGLIQGGLLVRAHNSPGCTQFMQAWWNEIVTGSVRDQLSFPYVAWKLNAEVTLLPRRFASGSQVDFRPHSRQIVYDSGGRARVPFRYWPVINLAFRARDRLLLLLGRI